MPLPRILVLFNEPTLPSDHPDADSEHDILYTADTVIRILQQAGLPVSRLGVTTDPKSLLAGIAAANADVVYNLYEGTATWGVAEAYVSGILELLKLPYTGSPTQPLMLCRSKPLTKQLLAGSGLPTAPFLVADSVPVPTPPFGWPVIAKPGLEDASVGIDQKSVATSNEELDARTQYLIDAYKGPVLVEKFVRGREFNVAMIATRGKLEALPFSEILFVPPPENPGLWPILTFDAKWKPNARDFAATPVKNPADVDPVLHEKVATAARKAFELVGCRDYARVDFRIDEEGNPYILEVNPNPCISPLAGLAAALESAKVSYSAFVLGVLKNALRRGPNPQLADEVPDDVASDAPIPATVEVPVADAKPKKEKKPALKIRPARKGDAAAIRSLLETVPGWPREEIERVVGNLLRGVRSGWKFVALVGPKSELAGVAAVRAIDASTGTVGLELLAVSPARQRAGWGRVLFAAAEKEAALLGRVLFAHLSSATWFAAGRQYLPKLGFRPAGEVAEFYRDGYTRISFAKLIPAPAPAVPAAAEENPPPKPESPVGTG